jgi:UDP-N-acetylglucosamine--N-acetylmuramyl-(pentapeptide) pyrophosphoryl-undecaprenol N-acetylglucosamine transferase
VTVAPSVVIAAGGTGGHIFPGLALADEIARRSPEARICFVGTPRGLEGSLIPERGYPLRLVDMRPLPRSFGLGPVRAGWSLLRATVQAGRILRREGATVAVGMGGYASLPVVAAAWLRRIPRLVHESGAVPGLANRVAARLTPNLALSFRDAGPSFPPRVRRRARVTGMPMDPAVARLDRQALRADARKALDLPESVTAVLVLGGSLGAMRLNQVGVGLAGRWKDRTDVRLVIKAGKEHADRVTAELDRMGATGVATAMAFLERMDHAYAAADVAVCRAGAGTVAELAAAGLPAVLVPYPHATGDHQTRNAGPLVRAGAAVAVPDADATAERIGPILEELAADPARRSSMSDAARSLGRPDAAEQLAAWVLDLSGGTEGL